jgi:hypothetical protein
MALEDKEVERLVRACDWAIAALEISGNATEVANFRKIKGELHDLLDRQTEPNDFLAWEKAAAQKAIRQRLRAGN